MKMAMIDAETVSDEVRDERTNQKLFDHLLAEAKSLGIAVIINWCGKKDYSQNVWDYHRFTSNGSSGDKDTCVFCGDKPLPEESVVAMDGFYSCRLCFREGFVESSGSAALNKTEYRPPIILLDAKVPGSIEKLVQNLAELLCCHKAKFPDSSSEEEKRIVSELAADNHLEHLVQKVECEARALELKWGTPAKTSSTAKNDAQSHSG
jgi:hypothetical protein